MSNSMLKKSLKVQTVKLNVYYKLESVKEKDQYKLFLYKISKNVIDQRAKQAILSL